MVIVETDAVVVVAAAALIAIIGWNGAISMVGKLPHDEHVSGGAGFDSVLSL